MSHLEEFECGEARRSGSSSSDWTVRRRWVMFVLRQFRFGYSGPWS